MSEIAYPVRANVGDFPEIIWDSHDRHVADTTDPDWTEEERLAISRRIVACLNACRDISTEELESMTPVDLLGAVRAQYGVFNSGAAAREG